MEDAQILALYWARSEDAIAETAEKYGRYCYRIAWHILYDAGDAEESVNDTWLNAWQSIPPHRPSILSAFLGKITRGLAIDKYRTRTAGKRGGGEFALALEELDECVASKSDVQQVLEAKELAQLLNRFLAALPAKERDLFVCRYWFLASIKEISRRFGISESNAKTSLYRTRKKLCTYLKEAGC